MRTTGIILALGVAIGVLASHSSLPVYGEDKTSGSLPRVLIIGDSISNGYMTPLIELLGGKAEVVHNPGNARYTGYGLEKLDEWLGDTNWDVIHFNFGLHDLKYVDDKGVNASSVEAGHIQVPLPKYRENLEAIVKRLKETGAKLIFATTTPFPSELTVPIRKPEDVPKYNAAALEVMKKYDVSVNDLNAYVAPRLNEMQLPKDVHFTKEGYRALAERVADAILGALGGTGTGQNG